MRNNGVRRSASAMLVLVAVLAAGCGGEAGTGATPAATAAASSSELPQGSEHVELDPADFSTTIDNPFWPMAVGSRWEYEETDSEGTVLKVVVTVTDKTKKIANGVTARVVHDVVTEDGEPIEVTDDYYAQDSAGNVWYLGEATAEYEDGKVSSTKGSFEAGKDGAEAGVIMPADPQPGMKYRQEYYEGEAEDQGEVVSIGEDVEVPAGKYTDVLKTKDTNPLEPNILEHKYYARGIGPVLAESREGDREELVKFTKGA